MSRGKNWRLKDASAQRRRARTRALRADRGPKAEKRWKLLYTRGNKVARAQQLGFDYPRKSDRELLDEHVGVVEENDGS